MSRIKASDDVLLALDIGTNSVKAVLARPSDDGKMEIIGSGKAEQFSGSIKAGAIMDVPIVTSVCEQAIGSAEKISGVRAKKTAVGISGDFVKSKTSTTHYVRENDDKPITGAEFSAIMEKIREQAQPDIAKIIAEETLDPLADVEMINSSIVSVTIDGEVVDSPVGLCGRELVIRSYMAFAPLSQITALEKVCAELELDLVTVAVEPFAICRAYLGEDPDNHDSAIFVDVGESTTDIAHVIDGSIDGTKSFSLGLDYIGKDFSIWLSGLEMALDELAGMRELPHKIFLSGGGAKVPDFCEALAISDWYKNLNFSHRPIVTVLDSKELTGFSYDQAKFSFDELYITSLGLLKVGCDAIIMSDDNRLRKKFLKTIKH